MSPQDDIDEVDKVYKHQIKVIEEWREKSETRFLRYGAIGLSVLTAACGLAVTAHYRTALKLRSYGLISSYAPVMLIPAATVGTSHHVFVVRDLLVFETPCPVCLNLRAVGIQMGFSVFLPVIMGTVSNFHLAERRMTYPLPLLVEDPRAWLTTWRKLSRSLARPLFAIAVLNAVCAAFVTHMEATEFYTLLDKRARERRWKKLNASQTTEPTEAAA